MIREFKNYNLRLLNTFRMDICADHYIAFDAEDDIKTLVNGIDNSVLLLILGGGSNLLLTNNFKGYVLHPQQKGIHIVADQGNDILVNVKAGEEWDAFVGYAVNNGCGGIENLSLIPGNVGACPIQNIGAYGVEVKDTIEKVRFFNLESMTFQELSNKQCHFGYRDSIFKHSLKNKCLITEVTFRLKKNPLFNLEYGSIGEEIKKLGEINLVNIRQTIINIRTAKLPDPAVIPNSGSFFKNPVVAASLFDQIQSNYPKVPHFTISDNEEKIPAAWLIEQCGWKGFREGDAGVHAQQPLVLVNYGNADGNAIIALAKRIIQSVKEKFSIELEMEVNIF